MDDFAVVGSGIGGACSALFLSKKFQTTLYEKELTLGGCASTFKHQKNFYNAGATTFAGYEKNTYMYDFFEHHHINFQKKLLPSALSVFINGKKIIRFQDMDAFLDEINSAFYHQNNKAFYELVQTINKDFFTINDYYYSNASAFEKLKSLSSFKTLFLKFYPYLFTNAQVFIQNYFGKIDERYLDFLDNQVLIVAQAKLHDVNFLTAALALSYQFMDNYYIFGGMGSIFDAISLKVPNIKTHTFIEKMTRTSSHFILHTSKAEFEAKNIVLNTPIFDAKSLFADSKTKEYLSHYTSLNKDISAFMVYLQIDTSKVFDHHYQIILDKPIKYTTSNSLFISFGDLDDAKMKQSVTISVHTQTKLWENAQNLEQKMELEAIIKKIICEHLGLEKRAILSSFSATPQTFKRFINRSTLGGIPMRKENFLYRLPSNNSPIKGLYHVGDTTFPAQGWLGVMLGVRNLEKILCH
ncbi:MAG: NAD(P)-binding protein [Sulfurospirillaceae bacterium]|nr:NAD(P)-binding protein [Sulfurospirillaceae bacterium]MDD2826210.1 NAD(P)-binding protein [Sulfurospirillaceae bacterium]